MAEGDSDELDERQVVCKPGETLWESRSKSTAAVETPAVWEIRHTGW